MKTIPFLLLLSLGISISGNAQLLNRLKQKATSAVNTAAAADSRPAAPGNTKPGTSTPDNTGNAPASSSASSTSNNTKMKYPFIVLPGAKFYFSTQPFSNSNAGAKTNFTSRDFIYGRLELGDKTLTEAFKLDAQPSKGFHCLNYGILITPKGKSEDELQNTQTIQYTIYNRSRPILIKEEEMKKTALNFDVLPEPSKITTLQGITVLPDRISDFKFAAGMDFYTSDLNIRQYFPANGDYTVQVLLWNYSFDDWGKPLEYEKNIVSLGAFDYQFSAKDAATLSNDIKRRTDALETKEKMKTKLTKLPDWWKTSYTPAGAMFSAAKLTPMIKSYISQWGLTYISHKIYPNSGTGWTQYTDSQTGLPVSRRSNAEIYLLYKDKDGTCHIASVTLDEPYAGGGTYGSPYLKGLWNDYLIDCSAIK